LVYELFAEKYFDKRSLDEQRDIMKTLQEETKEHVIFLIEKSINLCNTNNIVLSGGYFLNCVNNYQYLKAFPDVNFFVDPIAYDGGLSIGAARYLWWDLTKDQTIRKLEHLYLGEQL
jgi:carbamoyltransferase